MAFDPVAFLQASFVAVSMLLFTGLFFILPIFLSSFFLDASMIGFVFVFILIGLAYFVASRVSQSFSNLTPVTVHTGELPEALIIGAGFAGLNMAIELKRRGIPFKIFEKSEQVGGVWQFNSYPGAGCDIPTALYQLSFFPNFEWSRKWAKRDEILSYINQAFDALDIRRFVNFGCEVKSSVWNEKEALWEVTYRNGNEEKVHKAQILIPCVGQLGVPSMPKIENLESFSGPLFHSAKWDHSVDLKGKRVGVIGAAATAIQAVPELALVADKLTVFQRTPSYILPKTDWVYPGWFTLCFKHLPFFHLAYRLSIYMTGELFYFLGVRRGTANKVLQKHALVDMGKMITDQELEKQVKPEYDFFCKRVLFSSEYLQALQRDNVELVSDQIIRMESDGPVTAAGKHQLDVIVCCTGFKTLDFLFPMEFTGLGGQTLNQYWGKTPKAFLGISVPNFPNLFISYGPNTNLNHNSIIFVLECQCAYIARMIDHLIENKFDSVDLKESALDEYAKLVDETLDKTVFTSSCNSWYRNELGKITTNSPFSTLEYWKKTREFSPEKYSWSATK